MKIRLIFISIIAISLTGCVETGQFVALENRVAAMEMDNNRKLAQQRENKENIEIKKDISKIKKRLDDGHVFTREEYAQLKYDLQSITKELQRLQGQIEEMKYRFDQYTQKEKKENDVRIQRLDDAISTNAEKLIRLERHVGFEPTAIALDGETEPEKGPEPKTPTEIEQAEYAASKQLFDDGDMENARIRFERFIKRYPDSQNADNARFWIADSYYVEKRFAEAILEYQKVLESYPGSNKLAAARLKQGYAFAELGEHANARLILNELLKKYPDSQEAQYAAEKLKKLK